jgi:hypothetical protein
MPAWIVQVSSAYSCVMAPSVCARWPRGTLNNECFRSGSSTGYQLASIFAGGPAPLIATFLFGVYKTGMAVAGYIAVYAVSTLRSATESTGT